MQTGDHFTDPHQSRHRDLILQSIGKSVLAKSDNLSPKTRVSERMSCKESAIFFANRAYTPHIRQHHSTFQPTGTKFNWSVIQCFYHMFFGKILRYRRSRSWGISATVNHIFGLFITHYFTNSTKNAKKEAITFCRRIRIVVRVEPADYPITWVGKRSNPFKCTRYPQHRSSHWIRESGGISFDLVDRLELPH